MAIEYGTILVAKNYIKCYGIGRQFEVGTEFFYLFSYQGCYIVQRSMNGKVYDGDKELPQHSGEGGILLAVKPCDVEVQKENKKSKNAKTNKEPPIPKPLITMEDRVRDIVREEVMQHLKLDVTIWHDGGNHSHIAWDDKVFCKG